MRIIDLPGSAVRAITDYGSVGLGIAPVTNGTYATLTWLGLDAHGRIGSHRVFDNSFSCLYPVTWSSLGKMAWSTSCRRARRACGRKGNSMNPEVCGE